MKALLVIMMFLVSPLAKRDNPLTLPVTINGHIRPNPNDNSWGIKHLVILVKGKGKVLAKAITNNHGDFKLTFTPKDERSFDFYCKATNSVTLLIASVKTFESDTPEMFFDVPLKIQYDKNDHVICPKCKKADKTFKVVLSHPPGYDDLVKKGIIDTTINHRGIYSCSRDSVSF